MKYAIAITPSDGNTLIVSIDSKNSVEAHRLAGQFAIPGAKIRVYPDTSTEVGIAKGALMVARRTSVNAVTRGGATKTEEIIEKEFALVNARCRNADTAERILQVIGECSQDVQDYYSDAQDGLIQGIAAGMDIAGQYSLAYATLNKAIQSKRSASQNEVSTEYIKDDGGDIVEIGTLLATIVHEGGSWIQAVSGDITLANKLQLRRAIVDIMALLSPTRLDIVKLLAMGYSQRAISREMGKDLSTVNKNIAIIRGIGATYFRDNMPDFADTCKTGCGIKATASIETAARAKREYRSEEALAKSKATQAARQKHTGNARKQKGKPHKPRTNSSHAGGRKPFFLCPGHTTSWIPSTAAHLIQPLSYAPAVTMPSTITHQYQQPYTPPHHHSPLHHAQHRHKRI